MACLSVIGGIYLLAYWDVLWAPGHIFQNWDQTFPAFPDEVRAYGSIPSSTWTSVFELGSPGPMTGMTFYFDQLVRQGLAELGGSVLARWLNLAYAIIGAIGFWILTKRMGLSDLPSMLVCAVSQFNPRTYSLVLSGHSESSFAYSLTPWIVILADIGMRSSCRRIFVAAGLGMGVILGLACSTAFGITLAAPLLVLFILASSKGRFFKGFSLLVLSGIVAIVLHLHWILPTFSGSTGSNSFKYNQATQDILGEYLHKYREYSVLPRLAMIGHTDNLGMGTEYAYPVEPPKDMWWKPSAYALLGFALLGLLCPVSNPRLKWFAALSLLFGFVVLTGAKTLAGAYFYEIILARVKVLFFFMARPTRWLLVYYTGLALLAGLGLEAIRRRTFWTGHRWPDVVSSALAVTVVTVYLWPWWSGQLTKPKNETTQTMALMPQPLLPQEEQLATALAQDPGLYRITVFPTISSPTGNIPDPPSSSLTRNFGMMGKDSLVGPAFVGNPYGRFLLSLAHRRAPSTDEYGRLLGLGAVRRVVWDKEEAYLSYMDFGWMPSTKRGSETLPDPRGILRPFLDTQRDLLPDPDWSFGPFTTLNNTDYLPRIRTVASATIATGGFPLLESLAQLKDNPFEREAVFFCTDMDSAALERLGQATSGLRIHNDSWPELLLPFIPVDRWIPALHPGNAAPIGWTGISERWHHALWFEGSPLNARSLWSLTQASLIIPLRGVGPHRVFLRAASLPGQHGLDIGIDGHPLATTASADAFDRSWRWIDLGLRELTGNNTLNLLARGRGAVVSGVLTVPEDEFTKARQSLERFFPTNESNSSVLAEAEACVEAASGVYSQAIDIPLLASFPGLTFETTRLRVEDLDGSGLGVLAAEGDLEGQALFRLDFPQPVSGFSLVSYPRMFGDENGQSSVNAQWSRDGKAYLPLYQIHGATDGKWEDVYGRRQEVSIQGKMTSLWLKISLRQAQLSSLGNPPNQPMAVSVMPAEPYPGAPSMGQAVVLPARFAPRVFRSGPHQVRARMLTSDGPRWMDLGILEPDKDGVLKLSIDGPAGAACDLFELISLPDRPLPGPLPAPEARRQSPARYQCTGQLPPAGLLLFSEAYHPAWLAHLDGISLKPLKAYGFMNAYPLPETPQDSLQLEFSPERYREIGKKISLAGWVLFSSVIAVSLLWPNRKNSPDRQ